MSTNLIEPQDSFYQKGSQILDTIFLTLGGPDLPYYKPVFYNFNSQKAAIQEQAKEAFGYFEQSLSTYPKGNSEQIYCLEKLAICSHFQIQDYSYSKSLEPLYHQTKNYIDQAIEQQAQQPISARLAQIYEVATRLTIPHFYFSLIYPLTAETEQHAFAYLSQAKDIYLQLDDSLSALRVNRFIPSKSLNSFVESIELGRSVEGDTSLAVAEDIRGLFRFVLTQKLSLEEAKKMDIYALLGVAIFQQHPSKHFRYFLRDLGYYYKQKAGDLNKALDYYSQAQILEKEYGDKLYYTAYHIASICIKNNQLDLAKAQYQLALTQELSPTDKEAGYFGLVMIEQLKGQKKEAIAIWKKHLWDTKIMNGISSYYSYFSIDKKPAIKKLALELVEAVGAVHATRIITEDWRE